MEKSILLVPVLLTILKNYRRQAAKVSLEIKQVEHSLSLTPKERSWDMEQTHQKLLNQFNTLNSDLVEKEILIEGFSEIYEDRQWELRTRLKSPSPFLNV